MGSTKFHVGHASNHKNTKRAATPNAGCYTGGFYKSPSNAATVDSLKPLEIAWDNSCLDTTNADIYVLAPGSHTLSPHIWNNIPFAPGKYTLQLQPRWWNDSATQSLQISIVPANSPLGLNTLPAGPVITATYTAPTKGKIPEIADLSPTAGSSDLKGTKKPLAPGRTAAAVLFPLLIVFGLIFAYFRFQRKRTSEQSKRFSQALDKRMSTITTDWQSISAAGATAAIRSSMARDSGAFAFGNIRPMSTMELESGHAGVGAQQQVMTQVRTGTGVGLRNPAAAAAVAAERASRVSRVSFAASEHPRTSMATSRVSFADSRPSMDSSRRNRAFHQGHVPPVPTLRADVISTATSVYPDSEIEAPEDRIPIVVPDEEKSSNGGYSRGSPTLSPRQTQGPLTLTSEDIRARMEGREEEGTRQEMDEVLPALAMMRTGLEPTSPPTGTFPLQTETHTDDYLLPASPPPTHAKPTPSTSPYAQSFSPSPSAAFFTHQPATMMMSPDDMLRAYAERQRMNAGTPPSAFAGTGTGTGSPRTKGRKLSLRASIGAKLGRDKENGGEKKEKERDKKVIGYPVSIAEPGHGAEYAIGDDEDTEYAYVGMAN